MGKSVKVKNVVAYRDQSGAHREAYRGKATDKDLKAWVNALDKSMLAGGVNAHVSQALGFIPVVSYAEVQRQSDGKVLATYKAPMFQVL